jgi:hypothetical protein
MIEDFAAKMRDATAAAAKDFVASHLEQLP